MIPKAYKLLGKKKVNSVRLTVILTALCALQAIIWTGCSLERDFEILSFFFDGVPDPSLFSEASVTADGTLVYVFHQPALERKCQECHPNPAYSSVALTREDSHLCLKCHEEVVDQYEVMHGPVVGIACLWCHDPHKSPYPYLMRAQPSQLCKQCHTPELMRKPPPQEHLDTDIACLDCHFGHGGDKAYFLRANVRRKETGIVVSETGEEVGQ